MKYQIYVGVTIHMDGYKASENAAYDSDSTDIEPESVAGALRKMRYKRGSFSIMSGGALHEGCLTDHEVSIQAKHWRYDFHTGERLWVVSSLSPLLGATL